MPTAYHLTLTIPKKWNGAHLHTFLECVRETSRYNNDQLKECTLPGWEEHLNEYDNHYIVLKSMKPDDLEDRWYRMLIRTNIKTAAERAEVWAPHYLIRQVPAPVQEGPINPGLDCVTDIKV